MQDPRSNTHVVEATPAQSALGQTHPSIQRQIWHFARHYLEMCVAMCLGGTTLALLVFRAAPAVLGIQDLRDTAPAAALVVAAVLYTLPMATWMRIRHMAWRPTLEMSASTVGVAVIVSVLYGMGVLSLATLEAWVAAGCAPWCAVMLIPMLFRLPLYTGRSGHHAS
jgi:hypothetical protein